MDASLLTTKLYIPPVRAQLTSRAHLIEQLNTGLDRKLTLVSAPAGFGKTTLVSEWVAGGERPITWLQLDEGDNDLTRFLAYLVAALQKIESNIGDEILDALLHSHQPPPTDSILTAFINDIATIPEDFIIVLDDYHIIDSAPVNDVLAFLLDHLPMQMHLVIISREDPQLPIARLRGTGKLSELRADDLRFTTDEAAEFLNQAMGLDLSTADIAALENRTEGWITGLQLAAISMQGSADTASFIRSFTGSHRFVLDYLIEEVLEQQPESVQTFLLQTSILNRLAGSLCEAVTGMEDSRALLEILDRRNLFVVPLDSERQWYRYHHLFADLLRQQLHQSTTYSSSDKTMNIAELNSRASVWYEDNGFEIEAFQHAAAANDIGRAERLIEGNGLPLHFRGVVFPMLTWLESLPRSVFDANPSLWVTYAMTLLTTGQTQGIEEKLQAAEAALAITDPQNKEPDDTRRDILGRIANARANLAVSQRQAEPLMTLSRRALEYLHPDNLVYRTAAIWKLGVAYEFQGNRAAARQAFREAIATSEAAGNIYIHILAATGLGNIQLAENQLHLAADTYRQALQLVGDLPIPVGPHIHLSLARIFYEWNDLDTAIDHVQQSILLSQPFADYSDILVVGQVFLARMKLAQGDMSGASALLFEAEQSAVQRNFKDQLAAIAELQVLAFLRQGELVAAANVVKNHDIPISRARVYLAQDDINAALATLEPVHKHVQETGLKDERLKTQVPLAVIHYAQGKTEKALQLLRDALSLAKPGGFIRVFVDEGLFMSELLSVAAAQGIMPEYVGILLDAFASEKPQSESISYGTRGSHAQQPLADPLSEREIEVLQLIADGLTNQEVADRLYISLNTIKTHTRNIYEKLGVNNRTQAVNKARALRLIITT